jgi:2-dehydro-3-deoxygluconokinase
MTTAPRLVTAGEAMIRLSPPAGQRLRTANALDLHVGGTELNAAITAAQLDLSVTWGSSLPSGPHAQRILDHAERFGVDVVQVPGSGRVGLYFVEVGPEPRGSEVHYDRDGSALGAVASDELLAALFAEPATATLASGITLALGGGAAQVARGLLDAGTGATRFFEINHRAKLWSVDQAKRAVEDVLPDVDVLFASSHDLTGILGLGTDAERAALTAQERWDLDAVVLSGRTGSVGERCINTVRVFDGELVAQVERPGLVVDPVGAGDASAGAYIATWLQTGSYEEAAARAVWAAAYKQTLHGDVAVFDEGAAIQGAGPRIRR